MLFAAGRRTIGDKSGLGMPVVCYFVDEVLVNR